MPKTKTPTNAGNGGKRSCALPDVHGGDPDIFWGARAISKFVGRPTRGTSDALARGDLPGRKSAKIWSSTRSALLAHLSGTKEERERLAKEKAERNRRKKAERASSKHAA